MHAFALVRLVASVVVIAFSVIALGLAASLVHYYTTLRGFNVPGWAGFSLFTAIFSLLVVPPVLIIDQLRNGAVTSIVAVELAWTGVLGVFWLAAAASQSSGLDINNCTGLRGDVETQCHNFQALQAFSWLNWIILWAWMIILLVFSIIALSRGNRAVWTAPAGQTDFFARDAAEVPPVTAQYATGTTYPPQPVAYDPPIQQFAPQFQQQQPIPVQTQFSGAGQP